MKNSGMVALQIIFLLLVQKLFALFTLQSEIIIHKTCMHVITFTIYINTPSVLWWCWIAGKGIWPAKIMLPKNLEKLCFGNPLENPAYLECSTKVGW